MVNKIFIVFACVVGAAGMARAETWRMTPELVDQWSLFTCTVSLADRVWEFTLDGTELKANGPDSVTWTTSVDPHGAFKVSYTGRYSMRDQTFPVEMTGNVRADPKWVLLHVQSFGCWYRLVPIPGF